MNFIQKTVYKIDLFQRRHHTLAFSYGVIKKYGDDQAGYQSALLTYYGFLSLFPLLLVMTTVVGIIPIGHAQIQAEIITSISKYFPVLGTQLSAHTQGLHKTGVALIIGILFTFYGARGVADAFRNGVSHIWQVPLTRRDGFPKSIGKSLLIIMVGGFGLIAASVISGFASAAGHGLAFRGLSVLLNFIILFWLFIYLLKVSLPKQTAVKITDVRAGAAAMAIGLIVLQVAGGYLLTRELKSLDALYSNFAVTLGLLFWIYLQAQIVYYAVEIATVHTKQLWPRSLSGQDLTAADRRAIGGQATKEKAVAAETIAVSFKKPQK